MREFQFDVRLPLRAPVLSQASGARAYGVDTAGLRDSSNLPALPGSLIRGNLRHAWKALRENFPGRNEIPSEDETKAWFGAESETGTDDEPCRGWARFAEYWTVDKRTVEQRKDKGVRHRIERNQEKGAVESGSLQVIESPFSTGESVVYSGWIRAWCRDAAEADRLAQWIRKGLEYVPALGALKGAGFGRVLKVEVSHQPVPSSPGAASSVDPKVTAFGIVLTLDRPFCFARSHPPDSNRYESEDFIPGGASKGAIARRLRQSARDTGPLDHPAFPQLCQYFDVLRFTHAFPAMAANTVRPVMPPLSLMIGPKDATPDPPDNLYDVALRDGPGLIHNRAPAFSMDWKDKHFGMAYEKCGWGKPPERCLIIRTEINPKTGTAFKNKLFATECVTPDGYRWLANVDLSKVAENDRKQIIEELEKLLAAGLDRLGKTEAETKKIEILPGCPAPALHSYPLIHNGLAVVTLQSAARLLPDPWGILPTNDKERLFKAYQNAWQELSRNSQADHSLELVRFFARQQLVGGNYLWRRFQHRQAAYNPELLTLPGSVFVLRAIDESAAKTKLEGWLQSGLPQLTAAPGGEDWRRTPYLAANGYGEIAVNLKLHWDLAPKEGWRGLD